MRYRTLGRTGIKVSEIGFGAWGISGKEWIGAVDAVSLRSLHAAADLGVNFIDTALAYGTGHSERLVAQFLKERKDPIVIATKVPPKNRLWPARPGTTLAEVFPYSYLIDCAERSLKHLGVETIDILQFHVWLDDWADQDEWKNAFTRLKEQGKIRQAGISINDHQASNGLRAAETGIIDTFQVIYNIYDQSPEQELFPCCLKHNIGVIARVPLDEGGLTGSITLDTTFPEKDFRNNYFRGERKGEVAHRAASLEKLLGKEAASLPELALRFCLHPPAVSTVIPGMRNIRNVQANCAVSDGRELSPDLLAELKRHAWARNYYQAGS